MGRINKFIFCFVIFLLSFLLFTCEDFVVYSSIRNEIANNRTVLVSEFYPSKPCIDASSPFKIVFEKSMSPDTLEYSGSLAQNVSSVTWTTTNLINDTVTFTSSSKWQPDETLGEETGSLYIIICDAEGWPCCDISWTPEILDKIIYLKKDSSITSSEDISGGGSKSKPFVTMIGAMRAVNALYPETAAEVHITEGVFDSYTDEGNIKITSPLTIKGCYSLENWNLRDLEKKETAFLCKTSGNYLGMFVLDSKGIVLDGLSINGNPSMFSEKRVVSIIADSNSESKIKNCDIKCYSSSYEDYMACAITCYEKSSIELYDSDISVITESNGSYVFCSVGNCIIDNCKISASSSSVTSDAKVYGLQVNPSAIITNNTIKLSSYENIQGFAIEVYGEGDGTQGQIINNLVTITGSSKALNQYCIYLNRVTNDNYLISQNQLNIDINLESDKAITTGIEMNYCKNINIYNNVIRTGAGEYNFGCNFFGSTDCNLCNNSFTTSNGDSSNFEIIYSTPVYMLYESVLNKCIGNIFLGDLCPNENTILACTGIFLSTVNDIINELNNNVFINFNNKLLVCSDGNISTSYPNIGILDYQIGIAALNATYNNTNNLYYETSDVAGIFWTGSNPMQPTSNTPLEITQSSLLEAPDIDILGNPRTVPYSIGAYEVD